MTEFRCPGETQLDRIEIKIDTLDDRVRSVEIKLAGEDGEKRVKEVSQKRWHFALHQLISPLASAIMAAFGVHYWQNH